MKRDATLLFPFSPSFVSSQRTFLPVSLMPGGQSARLDRKRVGTILFLVLI